MIFRRNSSSELESRLRSDRPRPDAELIDTIVASVERSYRAARLRSLRVAFALASVGILAALAALGGVSYAASGVEHAAVAVKHVFVSNPKGESKSSGPFDVLSSLTPSKTSAGDQYLPPGVSPSQAATEFARYVLLANQGLQNALSCRGLTGAAHTACLRKLQQLKAQNAALTDRLNAAEGKINALPPNKLAIVATMLAIQLQQQRALAAAQAARRANCASATFKAAHKATCAKANPASEAAEKLKLGQLELTELENLLAALGA